MDLKLKYATDEEIIMELLNRSEKHEAPRKISLSPGHMICCLGIGKDHSADLIIDKESFDRLYKTTQK